MKFQIIQKRNRAQNVFEDNQLSWRAKGIYASLIQLGNQETFDLTRFSNHAHNSIDVLKKGIQELVRQHDLVINSSRTRIIVFRSSKSQNLPANHQQVIDHLIKAQLTTVWHRQDRSTVRTLTKFVEGLNLELVLYAIYFSKQFSNNYPLAMVRLKQIMLVWERNHLESVSEAQNWVRCRKIKTKPWNTELRNRIVSRYNEKPKIVNNYSKPKSIPRIFKSKK